MILADVNANILDAAVKLSPAIVIGVWVVGELLDLIKNRPERQDRKVIRDILKRSIGELTKEISGIASDIQILCVRLEGLPEALEKIDSKLGQIMQKVGSA